MTVYLILTFLFGISIGSFVNAFVYRLQNKQKIINDRSRCVWCKHVLAWNDIIPLISYIILKGTCRYCKKKISWQYFAVELISGVAFILPLMKQNEFFFTKTYGAYAVFVFFLLVIFAYDLRYMLIPDFISLPAIGVSVLLRVLLYGLSLPFLANMLLAAAIGSGFFLMQFIVSKGKWIGGGDIRLGFLMGAMLGWPHVLVAVMFAYVFGTVVMLPLLITKKQSMKSQIPLGVFLTGATILTMVYGDEFFAWYLSLLK